MEYIISSILGYLIGSIPTAYLLLKSKGKNITEEGSGNVGALNSYEVSGSKLTGLLVLLIDFAKGAAVVFLIKLFFGEIFILPMIGLIAAVFSHCYSPWLKFKGGRGLATAAGGSALLMPLILGLWLLMWVIAFIFRKNVHFGNISATILTAALTATSGDIINKYSMPQSDNDLVFSIMVILMLAIIMTRHIEPLKQWISRNKNISKDKVI